MRIALCLAGNSVENKRTWFREVIENLGLVDITDPMLQINGTYGRDRQNRLNFPEDWDGLDLTSLHDSMARQAKRLIEWQRYTDKPYTHAFIDYEARGYDADGYINQRYMLDKMRHGFDEHDERFWGAMIEGVRSELAEGVKLSGYTIPRLRKHPPNDQDRRNAKTAAPIIDKLDWVWHNGYPTGNDDRDWIDHENLPDHSTRLLGGYDLLKAYGKPVIPCVWPSYLMSSSESKQYHGPTLGLIHVMHQRGASHLGIWVDCTHASIAAKQANNIMVVADQLRRLADAGGPQGVE